MLGHEDARLGHLQQLLLSIGINGQLADHLAAQNANDNLSELAEELGIFEDTKTQARLTGDRDNEVAMSRGRQALDKVGRHLFGSALGAGCQLAEVLRLPKVRQADLTALDLVADILEYRRDPLAVPVRTWVAFLTENRLLRQFRYDDAVRVARAQGSILSFLRLQATAAANTFFASPAQASYLTLLRKTFGDCLTGRQSVPKNPDLVLLPMLGLLFKQPVLFTFLVGRLAHRTRLAGDWQHAEMIVARGLVLDVLRRRGPFVIATKLA